MNIVAWFEVLSGGMLTTVQDRGRPGYGSSGLTRSGAADRRTRRREPARGGTNRTRRHSR
ncbi:hypothetical protein NJ76_17540 [Rhodococcus sp. IITR03]|nr:hypothetical protein NJ76_17540 [Rhodococcus sp. IITR03]